MRSLPDAKPQMKLSEALTDLGVTDTTLTAAEKQQLDEDGYLPLPGLLSPAQLAEVKATFMELLDRRHTFRDTYDTSGPDKSDRLTLANLQNKSAVFDVCFTHPRVVAAVARVLGGPGGPDGAGGANFQSSGVHGRRNPPGWGGNVEGDRQRLHTDGRAPGGGAPEFPDFYQCNSIWLLSDFTLDNGATHVVPASHRCGQLPGEHSTPHPLEERLVGEAGTVVIFNSHVWHSAGYNKSSTDRPALTSFWGRGERVRSFLEPEGESGRPWGQLDLPTWRRLSRAQRRLFDVCADDADLDADAGRAGEGARL